jgi:hypothetical protein
MKSHIIISYLVLDVCTLTNITAAVRFLAQVSTSAYGRQGEFAVVTRSAAPAAQLPLKQKFNIALRTAASQLSAHATNGRF